MLSGTLCFNALGSILKGGLPTNFEIRHFWGSADCRPVRLDACYSGDDLRICGCVPPQRVREKKSGDVVRKGDFAEWLCANLWLCTCTVCFAPHLSFASQIQ
jgi:hypothetical protein